jgi:hypothetical protein
VLRRFEQCASVVLGASGAENGIAGDQKLRSCFDDLRDGLVSDAAVYLNPITETQFLAKFPEAPQLVQRVRNEALAAKAGIYAHYENMVDHAEHGDDYIHGRGRIDDYSGLHSVVRDEFE